MRCGNNTLVWAGTRGGELPINGIYERIGGCNGTTTMEIGIV